VQPCNCGFVAHKQCADDWVADCSRTTRAFRTGPCSCRACGRPVRHRSRCEFYTHCCLLPVAGAVAGACLLLAGAWALDAALYAHVWR